LPGVLFCDGQDAFLPLHRFCRSVCRGSHIRANPQETEDIDSTERIQRLCVVDLAYFENEPDASWTVVDFKTDREFAASSEGYATQVGSMQKRYQRQEFVGRRSVACQIEPAGSDVADKPQPPRGPL
jgi:hypothetical protein